MPPCTVRLKKCSMSPVLASYQSPNGLRDGLSAR